MASDEFGRDMRYFAMCHARLCRVAVGAGGRRARLLHAQDIGEKVHDMNVRYFAKLVGVVALLYVPGSTSSSYVFLL